MTSPAPRTDFGRKFSRKSKALFAVFCIVAALLAPPLILELFFYSAIRHPAVLKYIPNGLKAETRIHYWLFDAWEIQYLPSCARYDPVLGYTLKPGRCTFSNIEFRNRFEINSAGLRDDEASLDNPEIIVAGDSQAMGWGMDQQSTFPQVLERLTGKKILNTGVSSYGTVREMAMSSRYFSPALKYLIIQYSENDYSENLAFKKGGNRLIVMPETNYEALSALPGDKDYRLFQYMNFEFKKILFGSEFRKHMAPIPAPEVIADLFLNAVTAYGAGRLSNVVVIAFEVGSHDEYAGLHEGLVMEKNLAKWKGLAKDIKALDISGAINPGHFYIMDGHLTREGHLVVANLLASIINQENSGH